MSKVPNPVQPDLVDRAEQAIRSWSGISTRDQAAEMLDTWKYARDLTAEQREEVLGRFGEPKAADTGIIEHALAVLGVFGVEDREAAGQLLDMWPRRDQLTPAARERVLDVLFDAENLQPMYQPCPPWCTIRHDEPERGRHERLEMLREHARQVLRTPSEQAPHHRDITIDVVACDNLEDGHRDGPHVAIYGAEFLSVEKALIVSANLVRACEIIEGETP